jgi:hypothetical protein
MDDDWEMVFDRHPEERYLEAAGHGALQSLIHLGAETNRHLHQYAAPTRRLLSKDMQEKLPRELRDMIY